ncbi:MAG: ATP synthase subunit I [Myxococcales bacterium]|nr:ATP synthase subunit I [Myxococcales bacterium]
MGTNEWGMWMGSFVGGLIIGGLFFGGLWWTLRRGLKAERPAMWFLVSWVVRMGLAVGGFYVVGNGDWRRFLICLLGFIGARVAVVRVTKTVPPLISPKAPTSPEVSNAG